MQKTDFADLRDVVERVRGIRYPDLDATFVASVIRAEEENPEDDQAAIQAIQRAMNSTLADMGLR